MTSVEIVLTLAIFATFGAAVAVCARQHRQVNQLSTRAAPPERGRRLRKGELNPADGGSSGKVRYENHGHLEAA